jgi:phosphoribosylformylglycinamidine synthase
MLQWRGAGAASEARLSRLEVKLRDRGCAVRSLAAEFVHFIEVAGELSQRELDVLGRLLDAGAKQTAAPDAAARLWVVPRIGTISPWASKATDIARACGLGRVRRIERGIVWAAEGVTPGSLLAASDLLHDRMTESVLTRPEQAERLFARAQPAALGTVHLLRGPRRAPCGDRQLARPLGGRDPLPGRRVRELGRGPTDAGDDVR